MAGRNNDVSFASEEIEHPDLRGRLGQQARVFDATLSAISDFAYSFDRQGRFTYVNKALLDLWGLKFDQAVGKNFHELSYPVELANRLQQQIQEVFETKRGLRDETPYTSPTGNIGYYEYIFAPVIGEDGSVEAVAGSTRDITQRKAAEAEREALLAQVQMQRELLADAFAQSPAFLAILKGPDHTFEFVNERYYQLIGRRDIIGKRVREAIPEVAEQGFIEILDRAYSSGEPFVGTAIKIMLQRKPTGPLEEAYLDFVYQPMYAPDGTVTGIMAHGVDVTQTHRIQESLRQSEERFRLTADAMPQIVWSAQPDGTLDYYNRRWFEYINIFESSSDAARWDKHIHPDDLPAVVKTWTHSIESGTAYNVEFRVRRADGLFRWFLVRALPIRDTTGRVLRWIGTCTDLHDQKELQEQNQRLLESERAARAEAERASRMKDEFLATLSHELRTPLSAIVGWTQILKGSRADAEDMAQGLDVIERNARAQTQIIEDLLDMSRIISGKIRLTVQRIDLSSIIQASIETVKHAADAKGISLSRSIEPKVGAISGDPNRLQQVLWNLLSNAIKFTPRGGKVEVRLRQFDAHVEIAVADSGQGIPAKFLPHVFDRFRQADGTTTRKHGGLGLGLAIVKQLVELHGGSVAVSSNGEHQGTVFTLALPLTLQDHAPDIGLEQRRRASEAFEESLEIFPSIAGIKVLVVDDEADARNLVQRLLEDYDALVQTAMSAEEVIQKLGEEKYDILISDIGMPDQDGHTLIRRIRSLSPENGGAIRAVALTAYARPEDRDKAILAGFDLHLTKPIEPSALMTAISRLAGKE